MSSDGAHNFNFDGEEFLSLKEINAQKAADKEFRSSTFGDLVFGSSRQVSGRLFGQPSDLG
jgi:hypothetical protein